jgi:hypothetical protein
VDDSRNAHASLGEIRREVASLSRTFEGISQTWNKHQKIVKAQVDSGTIAWKNVGICLKNTKATLTEIRNLVKELAECGFGNVTLPDFLQKPTMALKMRMEKGEIESFKKKLAQHNLEIMAQLSAVSL